MNSYDSAGDSITGQAPGAVLETVEISTGPEPSAAVIWLHGLGADGHDFEPIVPQLTWSGAPAIRYIFPHAQVRPVTLNGGMPMRAWYDILSINADREHDRAGIEQSMGQVSALLKREIERGVPAQRIVVAGFSQGGAIALQLALRYPEKLAGLICLSTYLLFADSLQAEISNANNNLPVFVGHGTMDPMVPLKLGEGVRRQLESMAYPVEWHSYPMQHAVCPQEIVDVTKFLSNCLK